MVLPKREIVPEIVTAGLDTIAVRVRLDQIFPEIIRPLGKPRAAPSANCFGRISPTNAQHVLDDLKDQIPLIIDDGPTAHGIESTIVAIRAGGIHILRRGPITEDQLSEFGNIDNVAAAEKVSAPGQLPRHDAPKTQLRLIEDVNSFSTD